MTTVKKSVYIGVDVGGTNVKCARIENGTINERQITKTIAGEGYEVSLRQILNTITPMSRGISGIGVGIAGIIDSKSGIVRYSPNMPGWNDIPLARILQKKYNVPVHVLNDVNSICLGEWQYGAAKACNDVFLLTVGTGVGGGAICSGKPQFGAHGFAGEFGHIIIKDKGRKCVCGNHGCLESYVGAQQMVRYARKLMRKTKTILHKCTVLTPKIIAEKAKQGDRVARDVIVRMGYYLGVGITNIIHLYDPGVVIVSGGISKSGKILFDSIRMTVKERVIGKNYRRYRIVPPKLGNDAGILGAVYYAQSV